LSIEENFSLELSYQDKVGKSSVRNDRRTPMDKPTEEQEQPISYDGLLFEHGMRLLRYASHNIKLDKRIRKDMLKVAKLAGKLFDLDIKLTKKYGEANNGQG
jgi:hypothetical protein